ncbi:MAG: cation-transporting P-type ATPase [Patescibacteria group bacterium]
MSNHQFYAWTVEEIEHHFGVEANFGLSTKHAGHLLQKYGPNSLNDLKETGIWTVLLRQLDNFFVFLLVIAAVISYMVDGLVQALILVAVIIINIALGFFQEYKAERALAELKSAYQAKSKVLRGGKIRAIPNEELTIGDVVILESGDKVPADVRVIEEEGLRVDESLLSGESVPASKNPAALSKETSLADRHNMLFASTLVAAGRGRGIVVAIGSGTEFGKIANLVKKAEERTPLEQQIFYIGKILTLVSALVAAAIFILGYFSGESLLPLLSFSIALLVATVPESLPTAVTLSLAMGVARAARQKVLIRRMAAIETLGTINIIASDKTGTLTENHLVAEVASVFGNLHWHRADLDSGEDRKYAGSLLARAVVCSNVVWRGEKELVGDPIEIALVERCRKGYSDALDESDKYRRVLEIPFDSDRKYMAVLCRRRGGSELIVKGMPERVISFCALTVSERKVALAEAASLSRDGYKVLAVAKKKSVTTAKVLSKMELLGFLAFADEPAVGVKEAIGQAIRAGIRPIIITGDHPETARFIANKVGMNVGNDEILGEKELANMTQRQLEAALKVVKVFARVTPEDKINIVKTLQKMGYSVGVTGDGVNDAPALKEANAGIAMGIKGTEVAKSAADIVLADDRYGTIISAIEYGRSIFDNIKNIITFLVAGNLNEILMVGLAYIFGMPLPITTLQILWVNLITDSFPALALSFEQPSRHVLSEPPRSIRQDSLKAPIVYAGYLSIISLALSIAVYFWGLSFSLAKAQTMTFTFLVLIELIFCFSVRSKQRFWQRPRGFFENKFLLWAIALSLFLQGIIFVAPLRKIFGLVGLTSSDIAVLVVSSVVAFVLAELIRYVSDKVAQRKLRQKP